MKSFNLSDWALKHRSLVWYFMIAFMVAGFLLTSSLGDRRSGLHDQNHGDPGAVAGRVCRGGDASSHGKGREEA